MKDLCVDLEAYETDPWAAAAILRSEILTRNVLDPCVGTGIMADAARAAGYIVLTMDIRDWSQDFDCQAPEILGDFLTLDLSNDPGMFREFTVFMNPPFKKACEFVDRALEIGVRKVVTFQRWAWRESRGRREWWEKNPPARTYVCGDRATCWRFDVSDEDLQSRAGSPTAHGWFIWERGHKGAEVSGAVYK